MLSLLYTIQRPSIYEGGEVRERGKGRRNYEGGDVREGEKERRNCEGGE